MNDLIIKQIDAEKMSHAYLIIGQYCDKESFVDKVKFKLGIKEAQVYNIRIREGESNIGISQIRELKRRWALTNYDAGWRLCIIWDAGLSTTEAQNSMLKIIEEPPKKSMIIITANDGDDVIETIRSRCQRIVLNGDEHVIKRLSGEVPRGLFEGEVGLVERMKFAEKMSGSGNIDMILDRWYLELADQAKKVIDKQYFFDRVRDIEKAKVLLRSNANKRLILENLLLQFEK